MNDHQIYEEFMELNIQIDQSEKLNDLKFNKDQQNAIQDFIQHQKINIQNDLFKLKNMMENLNEQTYSRIFFYLSIMLKNNIVAQILYDHFKYLQTEKLKLGVLKTIDSFNCDNYLNESNNVIFIIYSCLHLNLDNLAMLVLLEQNFSEFKIEIFSKAIRKNNYEFTRLYLKVVKKKLSNDNQQKSKIDDFILNDLIIECLSNQQEKLAMYLEQITFRQIMKLFTQFTSCNFLDQQTIQFALYNHCFLFIKTVDDQFSQYLCFEEINQINFILNLMNDKYTYIHFIFLIQKVNMQKISIINVRDIIQNFEIIMQKKPFFFTFMINPIMICVLTIIFLQKLEKNFQQFQFVLTRLQNQILNLAYEFKNSLNDVIQMQIIFMTKQYPSKKCLMMILMKQSIFFKSLINSTEINKLIDVLWICEYVWTCNIFNSTTAFKNLKGRWFFLSQTQRNQVIHNKIVRAHSILKGYANFSQNQQNFYEINISQQEQEKTIQLLKSTMFNPFNFIQKSNKQDYSNVNHIFSYFYWTHSPSIRIVIELITYTIIAFLIILNSFQVFQMRRIYENINQDILYFSDSYSGQRQGLPMTQFTKNQSYKICGNPIQYLPNPTIPNPSMNDYITFYKLAQDWFTCQFQFKQKIDSYDFYESICQIIQVIYTQNKFLQLIYQLYNSNLQQECHQYQQARDTIKQSVKKFVIFQFIFFTFFYGSLCEKIYVYLIQNKFKLDLKYFVDLIMFLANTSIIIFLFTDIFNEHNAFLVIRQNIVQKFRIFEIAQMVFIFMIWIKFIEYLRVSRRFGFMLKIIKIMMIDSFVFLLIFFTILLAFANLFTNYYKISNPDKYSSLELSIRTLMIYSYGQINHQGYKSKEISGSILTIIFGLLVCVLILNVLIAILSNIFNKLKNISVLEMSHVIFDKYSDLKNNKYLSALVKIVPPWNILLTFLTFTLVLKKNQKLNEYLCIIGFLPIFVIYLLIFIILNCFIMLPLCWIKHVVFIYDSLCFKQIKFYLILFQWILVGYIYLLYIFWTHDLFNFIDSSFQVIIFINILFNYIQQICYNKNKLNDIQMENIMIIYKQALKLQKQNYRFIETKNFIHLIDEQIDEFHNKQIQYKLKENQDLNELLLTGQLKDDKYNIFSFIYQLEGLNGLIEIEKVSNLFNLMKFNKKYLNHKPTLKQEAKMINYLQQINISEYETTIYDLISKENKTFKFNQIVNEQYDELIQNNINQSMLEVDSQSIIQSQEQNYESQNSRESLQSKDSSKSQ